MMPGSNRVVITGIGAVTSIGDTVDKIHSAITNCTSGISSISAYRECGAVVAGSIPRSIFSPSEKELRRHDPIILLSVKAGSDAIEDSGIEIDPDDNNIGVYVGSGIGGLSTMHGASLSLHCRGAKSISPFVLPAGLVNMPAAHLSIAHSLHGPSLTFSSACTSGNHSIGEAYHAIKFKKSDVILAGGVEVPITSLGVSLFRKMNALSEKYIHEPTKASRPWDKDRDGFIIGEGAAFLVLESLEHALNRGAKIYAEIKGYEANSDANDIVAPVKDGRVIAKLLTQLITNSGVDFSEIDYINAHATSTPLGDLAEANGIYHAFKEHKPYVTSNKSIIGHCLGAAGAIEGYLSVLSIKEGFIPKTLNVYNVDPDCPDINIVRSEHIKKDVCNVISNSFGFGGSNASVLFSKYKG